MARENERSEGVSCTSYFWIYTPDPADFEVRRAISHLARAEASGAIERFSEAASDLLPYLKACRILQSACTRVTRSLVGEARRRRVSWADIGKQFGIRATGAQRRFRDAEAEHRFVPSSEVHAAEAVAVFNQAAELATGGRLSEDELDMPPEWFLRVAVRKLVKAAFEFENQVYAPLKESLQYDDGGRFQMPPWWWEALGTLRDEQRMALWDIARTGAIGAIFDSGRYWPIRPYIDETPGLYMSYACFQGTLASLYLAELENMIESGEISGIIEAIEAAQKCQSHMVAAFTRPECLAVIQVINWSIDNEPTEETGEAG